LFNVRRYRKKLLLILLVFSITFAGVWAWRSITVREALSIELIDIVPIQNHDVDEINEMVITIRNKGSYTIIPRFGIYHNFLAYTPVYWRILEGPEMLHPNTSATYRIYTEHPAWFIKSGDIIRIIFNDERNPNIIKITPKIRINVTKSECVKNGFFRYWVIDTKLGLKVPYKWHLVLKKSLNDNFSINIANIKAKSSLMLQVYQDGGRENGLEFGKSVVEEEWVHVGVVQKVPQFTTLNFYIFPTFSSTRGLAESGIRISDGAFRHLVILFSEEVSGKQYKYSLYSTGSQEIVLVLPTELNRWNYYEINMAESWGYLGWGYLGWELPKEFYIELYVAAHYTKPGNYTVYFNAVSTK
jgi:hypothetical protein